MTISKKQSNLLRPRADGTNRWKKPGGPSYYSYMLEKSDRDEIEAGIGTWLIYNYEDGPVQELQMMVNPAGKPMLTIRRQRNGTLSQKGSRNVTSMFQHGDWRSQLERLLVEEIIELMTKRVELRYGKQFARLNYLSEHKRIQEVATEMLRQNATSAKHNGRIRKITREGNIRELSQLLQHKILDPEITGLNARYFRHSWYTTLHLDEYNHIARNIKIVRQMDQEAPKVLEYHCIVITREQETKKALRSPELVTREVRNDLGLTGAQWRHFTHTGMAGYSDDAPDLIRKSTQTAMAMLQAANPPAETTDQMLGLMCHGSPRYGRIRDAKDEDGNRWRHGDPWLAMAHLVNVTIRDAITRPGYYGLRERPQWDRNDGIYSEGFTNFAKIADALDWHVVNQQPWGPTDMESYTRRADRWHRWQNRERTEQRRLQLLATNWDSLVPDIRVGNITAKPVTNGLELSNIARELNNCLAAFLDRCVSGETRIFTLWSDKTGLAGAGELTRHETKKWRVGQVESKGYHRTPSPNLVKAMKKACQKYQEAESPHP